MTTTTTTTTTKYYPSCHLEASAELFHGVVLTLFKAMLVVFRRAELRERLGPSGLLFQAKQGWFKSKG